MTAHAPAIAPPMPDGRLNLSDMVKNDRYPPQHYPYSSCYCTGLQALRSAEPHDLLHARKWARPALHYPATKKDILEMIANAGPTQHLQCLSLPLIVAVQRILHLENIKWVYAERAGKLNTTHLKALSAPGPQTTHGVHFLVGRLQRNLMGVLHQKQM